MSLKVDAGRRSSRSSAATATASRPRCARPPASTRSTRGSIRFDGRAISALPAHERVPLGLSLVPEGRRLFPKLTVRRNLELGAYTRSDGAEIAADVDSMFELFPILKERATQLAGTMSGGEQQMLAIARGLMARPKLLMLDEPSWGIAPKFVTKVLD